MVNAPPPASSSSKDCAPEPLHVHSWICVPLAVPDACASMHDPGCASAPKLKICPADTACPSFATTSPGGELPQAVAVRAARAARATACCTGCVLMTPGHRNAGA